VEDFFMNRVSDKVVVVTGGASGIGAATAQLCAKEGAHVVIFDIDAAKGEAVQDGIRHEGGDALFLQTDVTDEESIKSGFAAAVKSRRKIDALVNIAGGSASTDAPVHEVDIDLWETTIDLNLKGTLLCCRHGVPLLIANGGGAIVNTSSWAALTGFRKHIYVSAKGGVVALTRALAGEYARHSIRANVVCPGGVMTERSRQRYGTGVAESGNPSRNQDVTKYPFFRGEAIDIAYINLFLISDESRMITGATIQADGGRASY
jgi:NAD(P)-dependent dehydrogenase (short-subunit alcohol dehydrogenase family)